MSEHDLVGAGRRGPATRGFALRGRAAWVIVAAAGIVAGTVLRVGWLDRWCLWPDELASLRRATTLSWGEHLGEMRGNHPLYELAVLRPWSRVTTADAGIRLPSAVAGSLALALAWWLVRKLDHRVAAVAVWVLALSPLHVMYSRMARPYALAALWATCAGLALVAGVQRRRGALAAYVAFGVLLVLTNLFGLALLAAHGLVLLYLYRCRAQRLARWAAAGAAGAALLAPWLWWSLASALSWSQDTPYAGHQMGAMVKALYVPFALALGETVHPLNLAVVLPALAAFGAAVAGGVVAAAGRRPGGRVFLLEMAVVGAASLALKAAAPKHLLIAASSFAVLAGLGVMSFRLRALRFVVAAGLIGTSAASLANYFSGREFHDADMVTPWRRIAGAVQSAERPGDVLKIGYRGDRDVWRMFRRYYAGGLEPEYLDFSDWRGDLEAGLARSPRVWMLLHAGDPCGEIEAWLREKGHAFEWRGYQLEEQTMRGLREGLSSAHKYHSYLYRLYRVDGARRGR